MNNNNFNATEEEIIWLRKLRSFHFENRTPNHRNPANDVIDIAIEGLDYINDSPLSDSNSSK